MGTGTESRTHRFMIFGTSLKKFERSTSFFVAPHEMSYENRCASIAWLSGIASPPKKKKLRPTAGGQLSSARTQAGRATHKNGIHSRFVKKDSSCVEINPRSVSHEPAAIDYRDAHEVLLSQTVLQQRVADVPRPEEDDDRREPDLETVHVKAVDGELEPEQHIVNQADRHRGREAVCTASWISLCKSNGRKTEH